MDEFFRRSLGARVLTAAILAALLLAALFTFPPILLAGALGLVVLLAAWEWSALVWDHSRAKQWTYVLGLAASGVFIYLFPAIRQWVVGAAVLWWLWVLGVLWRHERGAGRHAGHPSQGATAGWLTLVPAWLAVVVLHERDPATPWMLLSLLLVVWAADTGAYFAGGAWGRRRLAPQLSPGKTVEGLAGGLVAAVLAALLLGLLLWHFDARALVPWLALCVLAALFSVVGDLYESLQKRRAGVKDSGRVLPGHGGILDRIDSLTAAAPVFLFGWSLLSAAS